jgi:hypothetical protein
MGTSLGAWGSKRHVEGPLLPAHVFVGFSEKVRLPAALLKELYDELTTPPLLVSALDGAHQGNGPLVDQGLEVDVVDGRQGEVEQIPGEGGDGGEVSVEEDGVQDG